MSKPARKRPRPPASGSPDMAPEAIKPTPEPTPTAATAELEPTPEARPTPEPVTPTPPPHELVDTASHPGGCYIKDGAPVNANGEPIAGYVVIDGAVYRKDD